MECLRRISRSDVSGLRKEMLVNWVESYVKLRGEEAEEFRRLLHREENREIKAMALTWLGKAEAQGVKQGIKKGKAQGLEIATDQVRQELIRHLEGQFGTVPEPTRRRLESVRSVRRLAKLLAKAPLARSIDELGLS